MTEVFNIDFEVEAFRKNNLDWRKFRDTYNRVSATKLERGIKPLPLSLILKLFGQQKVLNTYVITRKPTDELDNSVTCPVVNTDNEVRMKNMEKDSAVTKTLDFPGVGLLSHTGEDGVKTCPVHKRDALPSRPIFQRGIRVPGRYFPKPLIGDTEHVNQSVAVSDSISFKEHQQRVQTPRSGLNNSLNGSKRGLTSISCSSRASSRIVKGTMCKPTETLMVNPGRSSTLSSLSTTPAKSLPTLNTNGYSNLQKVNNSLDSLNCSQELQPINYRSEDRPSTMNSAFYDNNEMVNGDLNSIRKLRLGTRQVTFPNPGPDFIAVLQGRPKTLHSRDISESFDAEMIDKTKRSRTHVGFVNSDG